MTKPIYRIRPRDKKSVVCYYYVTQEMEDGTYREFTIEETWRWGQGFVELEGDLPYKDQMEFHVDSMVGWGTELDDCCGVWFSFSEEFTEEEQEEIEALYEEGGAGWLWDGDHNFIVEDDHIALLGPFVIDIVDDDNYGMVLNDQGIEQPERPQLDKNAAWPFPTRK